MSGWHGLLARLISFRGCCVFYQVQMRDDSVWDVYKENRTHYGACGRGCRDLPCIGIEWSG